MQRFSSPLTRFGNGHYGVGAAGDPRNRLPLQIALNELWSPLELHVAVAELPVSAQAERIQPPVLHQHEGGVETAVDLEVMRRR